MSKTLERFLTETAEKNGWIDHDGKFRPNFKTHFYPNGKPAGKPVNRGHAQSAMRYFRKKFKSYDAAVDHAMDHGWSRLYHDGEGAGVVEYDSDKIRDRETHRKAMDKINAAGGGGMVEIDHAGARKRDHGNQFMRRK